MYAQPAGKAGDVADMLALTAAHCCVSACPAGLRAPNAGPARGRVAVTGQRCNRQLIATQLVGQLLCVWRLSLWR